MKIEKTALLALGAAMTTGAALASNTVDKSAPNVLLILVDDLGLGDLSCQYAKDLSTPNIDRIFETGVRLDNFYANSSVSSPSRAALLTGRFPAMVGPESYVPPLTKIGAISIRLPSLCPRCSRMVVIEPR